jgi:predicted ATPase/DNA-binding SARP family transcriptional activator
LCASFSDLLLRLSLLGVEKGKERPFVTEGLAAARAEMLDVAAQLAVRFVPARRLVPDLNDERLHRISGHLSAIEPLRNGYESANRGYVGVLPSGRGGEMDFRILGPLEVVDDGRTVALGGAKQRALLAVLLLHANQVVSRDRLVDDLWGERAPETVSTSLHGYVSQLRKALEPRGGEKQYQVLVTRAPGYLLRVDPERFDLRRFEQLLREGKSELAEGDAHSASSKLAEALALWRGPPLAELGSAPFASVEGLRLQELRLSALEERIEAELALGCHAEIVGELETLVAEHPLRERLRGQLMLALYRSGRQAEALETYRRSRQRLVEELGIEPSRSLQDLERAILTHDDALDGSGRIEHVEGADEYLIGSRKHPPLRSLPSVHLPLPYTPFLGRDLELEQLARMLLRNDLRLLTLTGPGGTGKTRLALQAAMESAGRYTDGVWWVRLAPLRDAALVTSAVAQALGVKERRGHRLEDDVAAQLTESATLLVLDNAEHLLPDAAGVVAGLVSRTSATWLVTSRERLHVHAEQVFPVPTLSDRDGIELFLSRARALDPGFEPTGSVAELCERLENLPLALELAAAHTGLFPPEQLLERFSQRLDLFMGPRDADPRQQTLRATIDWSYELLTPVEQRLFRSLSCFAGGCTYEAAEEVCGADPSGLQSLLDKSLLRRPDALRGPRYWMLETIREYAAGQLEDAGEAEDVRHRHAMWCCEFVERRLGVVGDHRLGLDIKEDLEAVRDERDNIQAALDWAWKTGEDELALRLGSACIRLWGEPALFRDARAWLSAAETKLPAASPPVQLQALKVAGLVAFFVDADSAEADRYWSQALDLAEQLGERAEVAWIESRRAGVVWERGDLERALALREAALAAARGTGRPVTEADELHMIGEVLRDLGRFEQAADSLLRAREIAREIGYDWLLAANAHSLGDLELDRADLAAALRWYHESLDTGVRREKWIIQLLCVAGIAAALSDLARDTDAATLWGAACSVEEEQSFQIPRPERRRYESRLRRLENTDAWRAGRKLSLDGAVTLISSL